MPPAAKRRRITAGAKRGVTASATQQGIQVFGKISKLQVQVSGKSILDKENISTELDGKNRSAIASSKKRKLDVAPEESKAEGRESSLNVEGKTVQLDRSRTTGAPGLLVCREPLSDATKIVSPQNKSVSRLDDTNTPTKGARALFETLELPSSSPSTPTSSSGTYNNTPPSSPPSIVDEVSNGNPADNLPAELQDLVDLHSSFLTALSLFYAHNGPMIPADLCDLAPGIEGVWKRRRILVDDIQRLLALERSRAFRGRDEKEAKAIYLADYGRGKICVEISDSNHLRNVQRRPIDEAGLHTTFIQNLEHQWSSYKATHPTTPSPKAFVSSLPLSPIKPCASLSKIPPLLSKGQRRLEDLKAGARKAQAVPLKPTTANIISTPPQQEKKTTARSTDLFSRLKAKQLHQSTLPLPPSPETLARKSALQRLPEIAPVLESLAMSSKTHCNDDTSTEQAKERIAHVSFTLPMLVQHLQMSLRNPIAKEEVGRCANLLAEVAPELVGLREVGKLCVVTVRGKGIGREELGRRVGRELGEL